MTGLLINPYLVVPVVTAAADVISSANGTFDDPLDAGVATTLPAGVANGNLILYFVVCGSVLAEDTSIDTPSGYTLITSNENPVSPTQVARFACFYKTAGSSESAPTFTCSAATVGLAWAWVAYRISGQSATAPEALISRGTVDPPNLTPSWGSANDLLIAGAAGRTISTVSGYPTNYTDDQVTTSIDGTGNANAGIGVATRTAVVTSENPSAFTLTNGTLAMTLAVRPA